MDINSIARQITDDPDIVAEGLMIGDESFTTKAMSMDDGPIDQLLSWLDHNSLPLDPSSEEFQAVYEEYFGNKYDKKTFMELLNGSKQRRQLLAAAMKLIDPGSAPPESTSEHAVLRPGIIVMNRGTVIRADHIALTQGGRGKHARRIINARQFAAKVAARALAGGPSVWSPPVPQNKASSSQYILVGRHPVKPTYRVSGENNGHPDFWVLRPSGSRGIVRKFKVIMSINPDNVKTINDMNVRDWAKTLP